MNRIIPKAVAGIFAATALIGGAAHAQVRYESAPRNIVAAPSSTGVIEAIDAVRSGNESNKVAGTILGGLIGGVVGHQIGSGRGNDVATVAGALGGAALGHQIGESNARDTAYRVHVRLDSGNRHTFLQDDLDGLRVGDRVQLGTDRVYRYLAGNDRYDTPTYRTDAPVPLYSAETAPYRTDAPAYQGGAPAYHHRQRASREPWLDHELWQAGRHTVPLSALSAAH